MPSLTTGVDQMLPPVENVHRGSPPSIASKAYRLPASEPPMTMGKSGSETNTGPPISGSGSGSPPTAARQTKSNIPELDRVSEVLDSATVEIAGRLQHEHALVADVSHQLRSRLTAVRLRLDELSTHPDPDVVGEANEAMAQVDRLTVAIDELVRASRSEGTAGTEEIGVLDELSGVIAEWKRNFEEASRRLELVGDSTVTAAVTGSRLREAVAVLVDNALSHGGGTCTVSVRLVPAMDTTALDSSERRREPLACIEVTDEGAGVSDELAPPI